MVATAPPQPGAQPPAQFAPEERRRILDGFFAADRGARELGLLIARASAASRSGEDGLTHRRLLAHESYYTGQSAQLWDRYLAGLPTLPLSRCPHTGETAWHSFDPYGLDGLWWRYGAAARPPERLPGTHFALTGAVALASRVERAPFLCKPGPGAPYVLPRLLGLPSVVAVLSSVPVGAHQGYATSYFAQPLPVAPAANVWGDDHYLYLDERGASHRVAVVEREEEFDFELAPWIELGRLFWITPGDGTLTLHDTVHDCPYLGLPGRRGLQRIQDGEVW